MNAFGEQTARAEIETFVRNAARIILQRTPNPTELEVLATLTSALGPTQLLLTFESISTGAPAPAVLTHWPHGHYYSPVVDPDARVRAFWDKEQLLRPEQINGIKLDLGAMEAFWHEHSEYLLANPFPDEPGGETRFYNNNDSYPGGDAVFLGAMMRAHRPRRIVEVGSGNSTACMLDWRDRLGLHELEITCIEPDPVRLRSVLRPGDQVRIIEGLVQDVELDVFASLAAGDILFIDSTHILKTGSDVHYELFQILPCLAAGVIIHFHDCAYPFEYPKEAVFDMNFSWNEAYALRAFLMYNANFSVSFWNSMFYRLTSAVNRHSFATLSKNPGGGIWLKKGFVAA